MDFAREFRIRRNQADMERALTDLSYIFVRIFLWATIYACSDIRNHENHHQMGQELLQTKKGNKGQTST